MYFLHIEEYILYCNKFNGGIMMRLALNFKNGKKEVLSEEDTKKVIGSINYLKLIKYLMSSKKVSVKTINILDKEIAVDELRSMEVLL